MPFDLECRSSDRYCAYEFEQCLRPNPVGTQSPCSPGLPPTGIGSLAHDQTVPQYDEARSACRFRVRWRLKSVLSEDISTLRKPLDAGKPTPYPRIPSREAG